MAFEREPEGGEVAGHAHPSAEAVQGPGGDACPPPPLPLSRGLCHARLSEPPCPSSASSALSFVAQRNPPPQNRLCPQGVCLNNRIHRPKCHFVCSGERRSVHPCGAAEFSCGVLGQNVADRGEDGGLGTEGHSPCQGPNQGLSLTLNGRRGTRNPEDPFSPTSCLS